MSIAMVMMNAFQHLRGVWFKGNLSHYTRLASNLPSDSAMTNLLLINVSAK